MLNKTLLLLGIFFENDYTVVLIKIAININHNNTNSLSLQGHQDTTNGMWTVDIYSQGLRIPRKYVHAQANNMYELKR